MVFFSCLAGSNAYGLAHQVATPAKVGGPRHSDEPARMFDQKFRGALAGVEEVLIVAPAADDLCRLQLA